MANQIADSFNDEYFNFSIGDAVEIKREQKSYRTLVESQLDGSSLLLYMPMEKAKPVLIAKGEILEINYVLVESEQGKYVVYAFEAIVEDREYFENIPMMKVRALQKPKKIQRRDFFRLNIVKPLLLEKLDGEGAIEVITKDISAGGMLVVSPKHMMEGEKYLVYVNMIPEAPMVLTGTVLSSDGVPEENGRYKVRFYFSDINPKNQQDLMRQINQLQLIELKRLKQRVSPYSDAVKEHVYDELLNRFNVDSAFDVNMRYLAGLSVFLMFILVGSLITAMPSTGWYIPLFGENSVRGWNVPLLKINIFISIVIMVLSALGVFFDRNHYHNIKRVNLVQVFFLLSSVISILAHFYLIMQLS